MLVPVPEPQPQFQTHGAALAYWCSPLVHEPISQGGGVSKESTLLVEMAAADAKPAKVLFSGAITGDLASLLKKVDTINRKSGPFDALFCVGQFFGKSCAGQMAVWDTHRAGC